MGSGFHRDCGVTQAADVVARWIPHFAGMAQWEWARMRLASTPASHMRGKCDFCGAREVAVEYDLETMIPTETLPRPALICRRCAGAA